jgi:hypothetical protein
MVSSRSLSQSRISPALGRGDFACLTLRATMDRFHLAHSADISRQKPRGSQGDSRADGEDVGGRGLPIIAPQRRCRAMCSRRSQCGAGSQPSRTCTAAVYGVAPLYHATLEPLLIVGCQWIKRVLCGTLLLGRSCLHHPTVLRQMRGLAQVTPSVVISCFQWSARAAWAASGQRDKSAHRCNGLSP